MEVAWWEKILKVVADPSHEGPSTGSAASCALCVMRGTITSGGTARVRRREASVDATACMDLHDGRIEAAGKRFCRGADTTHDAVAHTWVERPTCRDLQHSSHVVCTEVFAGGLE